MNLLYSLAGMAVLVLVVSVGVETAGLYRLFGVVLPYAAVAVFVSGIVYRVLKWAAVPVPFHIPTTCGQQKSLPWIKANNLESPYNSLGVVARMALEVLAFRSLFRNTKVDLRSEEQRIVYGNSKYLWLAALAFHYSFLVVLVRHLRFFTEPVPFVIGILQDLDGFFQIGVPTVYLTGVVLAAALAYLLLRRLADPKVRYISLPADYFALLLLLGIALSGILMRYFVKVDIVKVKELVMGLLRFEPSVPAGIGLIFYIHLFLVCALIAYFPFSKLVHMAGVFLSPTRNLTNTSRMRRHVNPWNYPVKVHTYEEWEDEFRDKMKAAGLPVERE
jgi:nitrate reductase gamma subunit